MRFLRHLRSKILLEQPLQTIKLSNYQTIKPSNHQTIKLQTLKLQTTMIRFTEIKNSEEKQKIKSLFKRAIPVNERTPFFWLYAKRKRPNVSFVNVYDGDTWVGAVFFSTHKDLVYVWIFAIDDSLRSKGYGSAVFTEIKRLYPNHRILLGIEEPDENSKNNEQRIKRKQFYERNGFRSTGLVANQMGVGIEVMLVGDTESFHIDELFENIKQVDWIAGTLPKLFKGLIKKKN